MKLKFLVAGLFLIFTSYVYAFDDGDFQVWNTDVEEFKINKDSKIAFEQEFRWGNNAGEFYYQHYDVGFFYNLKEYLNIGGGYRQIYDLVKGKFLPCEEPYLTLTLSSAFKGFNLEDRSRMEYNEFDYKVDFWRYRNKFTLKLPWKFTRIEIQPYISDEIFIVFDGLPSDLNQNRFSSGLSMKLTKNLKAEIYYMLQSSKGSIKWADVNVLGAKLKALF